MDKTVADFVTEKAIKDKRTAAHLAQIVAAVRGDKVTGSPYAWVENTYTDYEICETICLYIDENFQEVMRKRLPTVASAVKRMREVESHLKEREEEIVATAW